MAPKLGTGGKNSQVSAILGSGVRSQGVKEIRSRGAPGIRGPSASLRAVVGRGRMAGRIPSAQAIDHLVNDLEINLFEGPKCLIDFAFSIQFDENLPLPRSARRIREEPE
jgi:hypothetical protein